MTKIFLLALALAGCGKLISTGNVPSQKNPLIKGVASELLLGMDMSLNFDLLPLQGEVRSDEKFWSGDSWRLSRGAINYRWNSPGRDTFNYLSPTTREFFSMPTEMLRTLSPAEKYDLYQGRYDYPLKMEVDLLARSGVEAWEGLCHGWAGASLNHPEPQAKVVINPDGIEIPFGSADIKALLTYAYSKVIIDDEEVLGKRCEKMGILEEDFCDEDLTALSFHAVITNKLGLRGESFIADVDRSREIWNHPIMAYESKVLDRRSSRKGRFVVIETRLKYADVVENNSWDKTKPVYSYLTLKYQLKIDKAGNMTSSKWLSRERPDFLWTVKHRSFFPGYLLQLNDLIK
jgi:hypothetical protein